jgi:hypothetical protein
MPSTECQVYRQHKYLFAGEGYKDTLSKYSENSMCVRHVRELRFKARCVACTAAALG